MHWQFLSLARKVGPIREEEITGKGGCCLEESRSAALRHLDHFRKPGNLAKDFEILLNLLSIEYDVDKEHEQVPFRDFDDWRSGHVDSKKSAPQASAGALWSRV